MRYDIIYDPGDDEYWIIDEDTGVRVAGPFYSGSAAERKLADYDPPPENDLEP